MPSFLTSGVGVVLAASSPTVLNLPDRNIRVADLANAPVPNTAIVARVPDGESSLEIDAEKAIRLLRNRFPGAKFSLKFQGTIRLLARDEPSRNAACLEAKTDIGANAAITTINVQQTECNGRELAPQLGYDSERGVPIARSRIDAGSFLGNIRVASEDVITKGEALKLRTGAGAVSVERSVVSLQTSQKGRKIFVRTNDGEVIAAPISKLEMDDEQ